MHQHTTVGVFGTTEVVSSGPLPKFYVINEARKGIQTMSYNNYKFWC